MKTELADMAAEILVGLVTMTVLLFAGIAYVLLVLVGAVTF